jgi:two-component system, cell cycle response regulator
LARYGGEEFAVVMPEADLGEARLIAERIREVTEKHPFVFNGVGYQVTVSLGGAVTRPADQLTTTEIVTRADKNLYQAKVAGRNRSVVV